MRRPITHPREACHLSLPPRRLLRLILLRSVLLWMGVRLFAIMGGATIGELLLRVSVAEALEHHQFVQEYVGIGQAGRLNA